VPFDDFHLSVAVVTPALALVSVAGELDLYTAERLRAGLDEASATGADRIVVDLSGISFIESTALGVLVQRAKRVAERGPTLALVSNDPRTLRVFEVTGLRRIFPMHATLHAALSDGSVPTPAGAEAA
jgi:anti-sigma B factor antagonist